MPGGEKGITPAVDKTIPDKEFAFGGKDDDNGLMKGVDGSDQYGVHTAQTDAKGQEDEESTRRKAAVGAGVVGAG